MPPKKKSLRRRSDLCVEPLEPRRVLAVSVTAALPDLSLPLSAPTQTIDLAGHYDDAAVTGTLVRFDVNAPAPYDKVYVELFDQAGEHRLRTTPATAANFLSYVDGGSYQNTFIHRSVPGFVVQGGGFTVTNGQPGISIGSVGQLAPVVNEPKPAGTSAANNVRGTIAMAKLGSDPNSATNQWFFNLADNSGNLDAQNGGFTVFGRVLGSGMAAVDEMAKVPRFGYASPFDALPLRNVPGANSSTNPGFTNAAVDTSTLTADQFVKFPQIVRSGELVYTATSSNPAALAASITPQGKLQLVAGVPGATGVTTITVRASSVFDASDFVEDSFTVPTIRAVLQGVTGPAPRTYASGEKLLFTVTFSEPMAVTGVPYLDLKVNGVARRAVYDSGAGTNQLVFSYTVAVGETATAGKVVANGRSIQVPAGAAVSDRTGNAALSLAYTPPGTSGVKVDGVVPVASRVTAPAAKTYRAGQPLVFNVNYSRAVYVNGTPQLMVSISTNLKPAAYIGGTGTPILSFRYVVAPGDLSVQGVVLGNSLVLNGGWIRDAVGNNARLAVPAVNTRNVLVDALAPTLTGLTVPAAGTYKKNQTLSFTVTFSEPMTVTGVPKLQAVIGSTVRTIPYVQGTGTRSLVFRYTLQATDHDADGIVLLGQIVLGGGTILDKAGNSPSSLTLPVVSTSGVKVS
jgi:cyclophilin family peptidyl-prolyl cis-trans isomerase